MIFFTIFSSCLQSLLNEVRNIGNLIVWSTASHPGDCRVIIQVTLIGSLQAMIGTLVVVLAFVLPLVYIFRVLSHSSTPIARAVSTVAAETQEQQPKSIMQPARTDLAPPKDDPFTLEELKQYDGSDGAKPIYVAIKGQCALPIAGICAHPVVSSAGTVFDVTHKRDTYGKGKTYNLFAGKDASKALGMSSLKEEDAIPDYSTLSENDLKTLNDWHDFFSCVQFLFVREAPRLISDVPLHLPNIQETLQRHRKSHRPASPHRVLIRFHPGDSGIELIITVGRISACKLFLHVILR